MTSGNAIAHETLEAYASAQGKSFEAAHAYAGKYFGSIEFVGSRGTGGTMDVLGKEYRGETAYDAIRPDQSVVCMKTTVEYPNGYRRGEKSAPHRITKVQVVP